MVGDFLIYDAYIPFNFTFFGMLDGSKNSLFVRLGNMPKKKKIVW